MANIWMGATRQYKTLAQAVSAASAGDTIYIDAGTYTNDWAIIKKPLTLLGVGGMAHFKSSGDIPNKKAIIVSQANLTVENLEFSGAKVVDDNGAGIRHQSGNLTVRNSYFHDNQEGILTSAIQGGRVEIHDTRFVHNGTEGDKTHGIYVGAVDRLLVVDSVFEDTYVGSHLKSRAANTEVYNSRFIDGDGPTNYGIDLSNGGNATIVGNYFDQEANTNNRTMINYGSEAQNPGTLVVTDNTLVNHRPLATGVYNRTDNRAVVEDNIFVNVSEPIRGAADAAGNQTLTLDEFFANTAPLAGDDAAQTEAGAAVTLDVLANDSDADGDPLGVSAVGGAAHGTVVDNGDGTLTYTSEAGFVGDDVFSYTVSDDQGGSDIAQVTVSVAGAPVSPVAGFAPDQIGGLSLWLDAADGATLVDSNGDGRLNRWLDKSGSGHAATAPAGSQQPGLAGGVAFDGNDVLALADADDLNLASTANARTLTLVFSTDADVVSRQVLYEQGGSNRGLNLYIEDGELHLGGWNLPESPWGPTFVSAGVASGTTYVASLVFDPAAGTMSGMLNGTSIGSIGGVGKLYEHSADIGLGRMKQDSHFATGAVKGDGFGFAGTLHEVAFHNQALDNGLQAGLHGHLLDKWSGTPAANLAPDQIAGLRLWFDGADSDTLVDGNNDGRLNQWIDKSGNGHTASAPSGSQQPGADGGAVFDGNDVLKLADASDLNLASTTSAKTLTLVFSTGADVDSRQVLYEQGGSNRGLSLYVEDGEVHLGGWNLAESPWGPAFVSAAIAPGTTYTATLTYSAAAGTLAGSLNGADMGVIGGVGLLYQHSADIGLGRMQQDSHFESGMAKGDGFGFAGTLHEAAFYNRALSNDERVALTSHLAEKWDVDMVDLLGVASSGVDALIA